MSATGSGGAAARLYVSVGADVGKAIAGLKSADAQFKKTGASARAMDAAVASSNASARGASAAYTGMGAAASSTAKRTDAATKATKRSTVATQRVTKDAQAARGAMNGMGLGMSAAQGGAFALAYGLTKSVKMAADFDSGMRNVNSIAGLSEQKFQSLKAAVLDMAGPTAQAPETLAAGMYQLVSSGFNASDSLRVLKASSIAATAGLTDAETATTAIAGALNAYQLKAKDAQMVSDLLFTTVDKGVLTFNDLAQGLGPVLPFATKLGVDLKQVGAMLSILTIKGVPAAEAMTYTKGAMAQLVKPTTELRKELKQLGVSSGAELITKTGSLQAALEALYVSVGKNDRKFAQLFPDIRGLSAAFTVTGKGAADAKEMLKNFNVEAGRTQRVFKEQSKGQGFTWKQLAADIKVAAVDIGNSFAPEVKKAGSALSAVFQSAHRNKNTIGEVFDSVKFGAVTKFVGPLGQIATQVRDIGKVAKINPFKGLSGGSGDPFKGLTNRGVKVKVDAKGAKKEIIDTKKGLGTIPGLVTTKIKVESDADVVSRRTRLQLTRNAKPIKIKTEITRAGNASTVVSPYKIKPVKVPVEKPKPFKLSVDKSAVKPAVQDAKKDIDLMPFKKNTKLDVDPSGAISGAGAAKNAIASIPSSKTVSIHVRNISGSGKRRAGGGSVRAHESLTEVNERGPEAATYPDGSFGMLGDGKRGVLSLPPGTFVHTASSTRSILAGMGIEGMAKGGRKKKLSRSDRIARHNDRIESRSRVLDLKAQRRQAQLAPIFDSEGRAQADQLGEIAIDLETANRHLREAKKRRGKGRAEAVAQAQLEIAQAERAKADAERERANELKEQEIAAMKQMADQMESLKKEMAEANRLTKTTHTINTSEVNRAFLDWVSNQLGGKIGESTRTLSPSARY